VRPTRLAPRLLGAIALFAAAAPAARAQQATTVSYTRAEQLLPWNTATRILGDASNPTWYPDSTRFWYSTRTANGVQFVLVDAARNTRGLVFDNARLARAMTLAADTAFDPQRLPFQGFRFADEGKNTRVIEFGAIRKRWACDVTTYTCTIKDTTASEVPYVQSPDRKWEAFVHKNNLYVRPRAACQVEVPKRPRTDAENAAAARGDTTQPQRPPVATPAAQAAQAAGVKCDSTQLTTDGVEDWSYGLTSARPQQLFRPQPRRPQLRWSPDGKKIAVARTDERRVAKMPYISYTSQRPRMFTQPYALPGDSIVPLPEIYIIDVASKQSVKADVAPVPNQMSLAGSARDSVWSENSDKLYLAWMTRGSKSAYLGEIDAATGKARIVARDTGKTYVEIQQNTEPPSWYVTRDGREAIWWSERDGWGHLYRVGADGKVINQVTSGPWQVGAVQHVDEASRTIWFTARGRESGNPYYSKLYRVGFDGSGLALLTPEDGNHRITFSPSGRWFVDQWSGIEKAPVTVLRSATGGVVRELEKADVSGLREMGWKPAQTFTVKARDGVTDLYGVIYLPPNVDTTRRYPVIDNIYPGPQVGSVGAWSFKGGGENFGLAELGFVVIQLDHLGTPYRSKAFHDAYYGNFTDNGLPDHIAAIKQLAVRYPYLDLDRVGIYGHSGGGFASTDALFKYPEFFKVAVSGSGNHDNRSYNIYWAEKYQGLLKRDTLRRTDNFAGSANAAMASNLRGKLLLMHGDMDDNVHPAMTIQVVDALIKANRSFDLIMAPNRAHSLNEPYFIRRRWDYFVEHLMGATPPTNYELQRPTLGGGGGDDTPDLEDGDPFLEQAGQAVTAWPWWK
jgi:dipeptidyl-peptidase 4